MRYIAKDGDGFHLFDDGHKCYQFKGEIITDDYGDVVFNEGQGLDMEIEPVFFDKVVTKPRLYEYIPFSKILFIGELNPTHHKRGTWVQKWGGWYHLCKGTGQIEYDGELTGDFIDEYCINTADKFIVPKLDDEEIFYITEIHIIPDMRFFKQCPIKK